VETPSRARRPRSARGEGEQLRAALLAAAESLLVEPRNAAPLSLREVARLAGVSPAAVYLHFASAQELIAAVVELESRRLVDAVLGPHGDAANDDEVPVASVGLADIATRYVEWGLANPGAYQLLFESADRLGNPVGPGETGWVVVDAAVAALQRDRAGDGGVVALTTEDATRTAMRAWAALHGIVSLRLHKGEALWPTTAHDDALAVVAPFG
jgi:AcrR family transcriptional regulator